MSARVTGTDQQRLFFALWPDDDVRNAIVRQFDQCPQSRSRARPMRKHNLHMTLHFIGNVDGATRDCLHRAAQRITGEAFELQLDRYGHFYRARVFWMGCEHTPGALQALYQNLGETLAPCGYSLEHRPFAPHVTLLRKLDNPGDMIRPAPILWLVNDFVLVESVPVEGGVDYRVIERYALSVRGGGII